MIKHSDASLFVRELSCSCVLLVSVFCVTEALALTLSYGRNISAALPLKRLLGHWEMWFNVSLLLILSSSESLGEFKPGSVHGQNYAPRDLLCFVIQG